MSGLGHTAVFECPDGRECDNYFICARSPRFTSPTGSATLTKRRDNKTDVTPGQLLRTRVQFQRHLNCVTAKRCCKRGGYSRPRCGTPRVAFGDQPPEMPPHQEAVIRAPFPPTLRRCPPRLESTVHLPDNDTPTCQVEEGRSCGEAQREGQGVRVSIRVLSGVLWLHPMAL